MKIKRFVFILLLILIIAAVAIIAIRRKKAALAMAKPVGEKPIPVSVVLAREGAFVTSKRYIGIVEPLNRANISARVTSDIVSVLCQEGDIVKKGDVLIKLDDRRLVQAITVLKAKIEGMKTQIVANNANIKSLISSVGYWKKQLERDGNLFKKNIVSAKQLETSKEKLNEVQGKLDVITQKSKTLEAELAAIMGNMMVAETNLSYTKLRAPFESVVCKAIIDPGDLASPGKVLMVLENHQQLKVAVQVPQNDIKYLHLGEEVSIRFKNTKTEAKLSKIYPAVEENKMMLVEAILPVNQNNPFISGQYVRITLTTDVIKNAVIIPSAALNIDNNEKTDKSVFLFKNGVIKHVTVNVLADNEENAAVSGDIKRGDEVVIGAFLGWAGLADGLRAEVLSVSR